VHIVGHFYYINVCLVEEILCRRKYNLLSYVWFLPIYSVKLQFNNTLTSNKYIIWFDRDYVFHNHLPDVVFSVSDFHVAINRIGEFIDGSSTLYRGFGGNKIALKLLVTNFLLPCLPHTLHLQTRPALLTYSFRKPVLTL
jgi:hypothetical protein